MNAIQEITLEQIGDSMAAIEEFIALLNADAWPTPVRSSRPRSSTRRPSRSRKSATCRQLNMRLDLTGE
jgi:hypothetical protein